VTADTLFPPSLRARAVIFSKARGILAGTAPAAEVFRRLDPRARVRRLARDGASLRSGTRIMEVRASARALLSGERTALNFLQRLSGVATLAREFARRARGATVLDTRKTTPGLREFEKAAVAAGGARNHRRGLWDAAMIKDNHWALLPEGADMRALVARLRARRVPVTVEAKSAAQARAAVEAGADRVLLDNFSRAELARLIPALRRLSRRVELEVSGGVRLGTVAALARLRPDFVSAGAITHSAPALDISMDVFPA
jgi:nicotinate-nucleotide pyrophosphorylase (carboxylating)